LVASAQTLGPLAGRRQPQVGDATPLGQVDQDLEGRHVAGARPAADDRHLPGQCESDRHALVRFEHQLRAACSRNGDIDATSSRRRKMSVRKPMPVTSSASQYRFSRTFRARVFAILLAPVEHRLDLSPMCRNHESMSATWANDSPPDNRRTSHVT
jgi:hypothetical protein